MGNAEPGWPGAVLFDLDGTLIDSAPDIRAAVNELLGRHKLPPLDLDQVKAAIGNGVRTLVERAFIAARAPLSPAELDSEYATMLEIYANHLIGLTTLMPGTHETLDALRGKGILLGLATNKPQRFIETVLDHFGLASSFGAVIGGDAGVAKKPAPDMLFAALDQLGVEPTAAVMVGDSRADVESARAAAIPAILLRGGYSNVPLEELGADAVLDGLPQLVDALAALKPPT